MFKGLYAQPDATEVSYALKRSDARVSEYMKVLNRAKLEEQTKETDRRTSSGRYMARRG
jgi:DNA-binding transcriptional regulator GbsR (MarR family)